MQLSRVYSVPRQRRDGLMLLVVVGGRRRGAVVGVGGIQGEIVQGCVEIEVTEQGRRGRRRNATREHHGVMRMVSSGIWLGLRMMLWVL